ncbi:hypothetical protein PybrP1_001896 [[Pythium] brassicae (nom. inval.)]|nr:hypothetical protein PybrP1_001896 [[Pythium] brassicae (nom. inval.)]
MLLHKTLKRMRLTFAEAVDGWQEGSREDQLRALGERLQTRLIGECCGASVPTRLALEIVLDTPPALLRDVAFDWKSVVASRIVLGGTAYGERDNEHSSSKVVPGALVPANPAYCASIRRSLSQHSPAQPVVVRGVVTINGDFSFSDLSETQHSPSSVDLASVQAVFVHGEVDSRTMDACWRQRASQQIAGCRCVPVDSYKELERIAELCGTHIVDSWSELLPFAVGYEPVTLRLMEVSATSVGGDDVDNDSDDDDDAAHRGTRSYATLFLQVDRLRSTERSSPPLKTLLARCATRSEAQELQQGVWKALRRITSALRCEFLLPSGGAYLCACAAEVQADADRQRCPETTAGGRPKNALTVVAMERVGEALSRLCVQLLQNTGHATSDLSGGSSFFDDLARVRAVQGNYHQGILQQGADGNNGRSTFYAACNFGGLDFSVLPYTRTSGEQNRRLDDFRSVKAAFRRSFRVVELALSVAKYQINVSSAPQQNCSK